MLKISLLLTVLFWLMPSVALPAGSGASPRDGTEENFSPGTLIFENDKCAENDTCSLKEFRLSVKKSRMWVIDGWNYGSSVIASYETDSVDNLEKYSFVQFIRGCMFDTYIDTGGVVTKILGHSKDQFSEFDEEGNPKSYKTFCFPDWVIDSQDKDPVYNSFPGYGRFYLRRWNAVPGFYNEKTEKYYGEEKPSYPELYVTDIPSGAFTGELGAVNASLEFKTCIYKTEDIPWGIAEDNVDFATPIKCFLWQNIYIYNYAKKEFEMKSEIDSFCLQKPSGLICTPKSRHG